MVNPRFPHTCTVYRMVGETSFNDDAEKVILYEGECRKDSSTTMRTFKSDNVIKGDYLVNIPGTIEGIEAGDLIDVTDRQGTYLKCIITEPYAGNLGTSLYFNLGRN